MRVLIVESDQKLARVWQQYLEKTNADVTVLGTGAAAVERVGREKFDVILMDLVLEDRSAIAIGEVAALWQPDAQVIFVTDTPAFTDCTPVPPTGNAQALLETTTPPEELTAIVQYYGEISRVRAARRSQLAD